MNSPFRRLALPSVIGLLTACQSGPGSGGPPQQAASASTVPSSSWRSGPGAEVELGAGGAPALVRTGPHAVVWEESAPLRPPYTIRATVKKEEGRLHEGYGLVFGGSGLDGPEERQRYSYFLVRGDGSFLIKRRAGTETPVVQPWTANPAVPRESDGSSPSATLEVQVTGPEAVFRIDGTEVARVPADQLDTEGYAGLRVSHDVALRLADWTVERGPAGGAS